MTSSSNCGSPIASLPRITSILPLTQYASLSESLNLSEFVDGLQLIYKGRLAPLENAPFSTPWARKRYSVAQRFRQYLRATNCYKLSERQMRHPVVIAHGRRQAPPIAGATKKHPLLAVAGKRRPG